MSADSLAMDPSELDLGPEAPRFLPTLTKGATWLGITGLTAAAVALFGMALSVILGIGTVVVGAIALVCVALAAVLVAALLLVAAGLCVVTAGVALTIGVAGGVVAVLLALLGPTARSVGSLFERLGSLRGRRTRLLQTSESSSPSSASTRARSCQASRRSTRSINSSRSCSGKLARSAASFVMRSVRR